MISAVVITLNEERNIARCLASLRGVADEVVVVDSGSTDRTEALCREAGARFVRHEWQGYSEQKNYANSLASHPWLLSLDADEALSPRLRESLLALKREGLRPHTAYTFNRLPNYCGRWIRHCGWYPDTSLRLWPNGEARWEGEVHEGLRFSSAVQRVHLKGDLEHYSYYTVGEHARQTVKFALLAGEQAYNRGRRCHALTVGFKPVATFLHDYLLRLGFLDGYTGYTICRMSAFYTFVKYARLRELTLSSALPDRP